MATLRIQMNNKQITMIPSGNFISKCSIKSVFLLTDNSIVSLSYKLADEEIFCESRTVRDGLFELEPCFVLSELWPTLLFFVDSKMPPTRPETPVDQILAERPISPYLAFPPDPAPTCEAFTKCMFYLFDNFGKSATICVHPRFFATFRHGSHREFKLEDKLVIYSVNKEIDEQAGYRVSVVSINETLDYILMKSEVEVVSFGPPMARARDSEPMATAGFGNKEGRNSFVSGIIYSTRNFYFAGDEQQLGP